MSQDFTSMKVTPITEEYLVFVNLERPTERQIRSTFNQAVEDAGLDGKVKLGKVLATIGMVCIGCDEETAGDVNLLECVQSVSPNQRVSSLRVPPGSPV